MLHSVEIALLKIHVNAIYCQTLKIKKMKKYWILFTAAKLHLVGILLNGKFGHLYSAGTFFRNYFAAGDFAIGVFAAGKFAVGIFSAGIFSLGIFSIGIFNIGLYAIGIFIYAWKKKHPKIIIESSKESVI